GQLAKYLTLGGVSNGRVASIDASDQTRAAELGRSLLKSTELVVLDNPLDGLAPLVREEMSRLILEWAHRGKTVVLSGRFLADLVGLCDRVAICNGGIVEQIGTIPELLAAPASVRSLAPVLSPSLVERLLRLI